MASSTMYTSSDTPKNRGKISILSIKSYDCPDMTRFITRTHVSVGDPLFFHHYDTFSFSDRQVFEITLSGHIGQEAEKTK